MALDPNKRMVVCSACKFGEGEDAIIFAGARHFDPIMQTQMKHMKEADELAYHNKGQQEQGFIDQRGIFMTREEAWKVAEAQGQIYRRVGGDTLRGGYLFSENLYGGYD